MVILPNILIDTVYSLGNKYNLTQPDHQALIDVMHDAADVGFEDGWTWGVQVGEEKERARRDNDQG